MNITYNKAIDTLKIVSCSAYVYTEHIELTTVCRTLKNLRRSIEMERRGKGEEIFCALQREKQRRCRGVTLKVDKIPHANKSY